MKNKNITFIKKLISIFIGALILFAGIAIMIRCNVGLSPLDSINQVFSELLVIPVGDVNFIISIVFFIALVIYKNKAMKFSDYIVLLYIVLSSLLLNFFAYYVFQNLVIENYIIKMIMYVVMIPVTAFGVVLIVRTKLITPPLEGLCIAISEKSRISLGKLRWIADGILIVISIIMTLIFNLHWYIGLGTLFALFIYGPSLDILQKPTSKLLKLLHLDY